MEQAVRRAGGKTAGKPEGSDLALDADAGPEEDGGGAGRRLTLKEMVRGAKTTPRAVRFYEEQKLICTAGRSPGGHRLFEAGELPRLRLVLELRTCGFSIEEIREILDAKARCGTVREAALHIQGLLSHHVEELRGKIETIQRLGREFGSSVRLLDRCVHCTDPRGAGACATCDLPLSAPASFCHIWGVPEAKLPG